MNHLSQIQEYYTKIISSKSDNTEHVFDPVESDLLTELDKSSHSLKNNRTAIDIGYGYGQYTRALLNYGYSVDAVDLIPAEILKNRLCDARGIAIYQSDIMNFEAWRKYNVVIAKDVLHFLRRDDVAKLLRQLVDHTKCGGIHYFHIFCDIKRRDKDGNKKVIEGESSFTSRMLSDLLLEIYDSWHINIDYETYKEKSFDKKYIYFEATKLRFIAKKKEGGNK